MPAANAAAPVKKNSNFQAIVKRLFQNRGAVIGLIIFIVLALAAIFAPVAAPYGYEEMDLTNMLSGPSLEHLFGTDELGRDVFSRIIYGGRYSLSIGLAATAFGAVVGCAIGAIQLMSKGDNDGLPSRKELERFMAGEPTWRVI